MHYILIFICFVLTININAQFVSQKDFRLKDSKVQNSFSQNKSFKINDKLNSSDNRSVNKIKPNSLGGTSYKSPWLSFGLSFLVPGAALGQLYNEQYLNFGIRVGISLITGAILIFEKRPGGEFNLNFAAILIYAANWITSFIEAPISSSQINKRNEQKKRKGFKYNNKF